MFLICISLLTYCFFLIFCDEMTYDCDTAIILFISFSSTRTTISPINTRIQTNNMTVEIVISYA